jgi:hypothetical protein
MLEIICWVVVFSICMFTANLRGIIPAELAGVGHNKPNNPNNPKSFETGDSRIK